MARPKGSKNKKRGRKPGRPAAKTNSVMDFKSISTKLADSAKLDVYLKQHKDLGKKISSLQAKLR